MIWLIKLFSSGNNLKRNLPVNQYCCSIFPAMLIKQLGTDFIEFGKTMGWYWRKKMAGMGNYFEVGKSFVVEILKARRGTYQKPFLHVGMVFLAIVAVLSAPIIINQYPSAATASPLDSTISPSAVLNQATDIGDIETQTKESVKQRRDVVEHEIKIGDTLSSIAKIFGVDADSIAVLNKYEKTKILKPGDKIKIPPVSGIIVTVRSGETIYTLAKKYGMPSPQAIVDWPYNTFSNDETFTLAAGQTLVLPGGRPPEEVIPVAPVGPYINTTPFAGGTGQFMWPTHGVLTQYFSGYHPGDDIANTQGTSVVAADSGRVQLVRYETFGYGWHVIINHGNGYLTLYGHLSKIDISEGQNVARGQQIGLMGSTGRSTGSHLHFETHYGGGRVNPLGLLK